MAAEAMAAGAVRVQTVPGMYRRLLRASQRVDPQNYGQRGNHLGFWIQQRFREDTAHFQHLVFNFQMRVGGGREMTEEDILSQEDQEGAENLQEMLDEAEARADALAEALEGMNTMNPRENPAVFACLSAARAGVGNRAYRRKLEESILLLLDFGSRFRARVMEEKRRGASTKNRAMQIALQPYAGVLELLEKAMQGRAELGWENDLAEEKADKEYTFHRVPELVVVETDTLRQRQTVYIQAPTDLRERDLNERAYFQLWGVEPTGVEFEQAAHLAALRVREHLQHQGSLREHHSVTLAGFSEGGAIAAVVGAYLVVQGVKVQNVLTFGQPRFTPTEDCPVVSKLPLLRVVAAGDAYTNYPKATAEGQPRPFLHYGEALIMTPRELADKPPSFFKQNGVYVTMGEYAELIRGTDTVLDYEDAPKVSARVKGHEDVLTYDIKRPGFGGD
eukprot:Hpha_TRINITY_DN29727_c0_g1::TRINITY_DN29727_c0_g1_i1::g.2578::m.2578